MKGLALLLAGVLGAFSAQAEVWHFALIGDTPYSERERIELPKMLAAIAEKPVEFVAHIGDIKNGTTACTDALFEERHKLFDASAKPFVYVPGDNEWTDCQRVSAGAYEPAERLGKLREIFFKDERSLGQQRIPVQRQSADFPEHVRFRLGPVLFVTLNLPGGNNNWGMTERASSEYLTRNPAVLAWLKQNFALARRERLEGIVLLFQANPGFTHQAEGFPHRGYRDFLTALREETLNFPGKVVAIHGDTHISRIDHPMRDSQGHRLGKFTRVETFGYPLMGWTLATIDTETPELFRFSPHPWPPKHQ